MSTVLILFNQNRGKIYLLWQKRPKNWIFFIVCGCVERRKKILRFFRQENSKRASILTQIFHLIRAGGGRNFPTLTLATPLV